MPCGGFTNTPCGADEFCSYTVEDACGAADALGTCKPKPTSCEIGCAPPEFQVCACDGQKYCRECLINKAGLSVAPASACQ